MKDENSITIQGWMLNKLHLRGNELISYALIYGFSQDEKSYFNGGAEYLSSWIGCTKKTAISSLKNLLENNLIIKKDYITENNQKSFSFKINPDILSSVKNTPLSSEEITPQSSVKITPNNNIYNNIDNKENILKEKDSSLTTKKKNSEQDLILREKFEEFWKIYPTRKNGKENIFKKYCKVIKDKKYTAEDLKRAATIYREEHTQDNFQYVCGIDKWFNQEYYVGILEANKPEKPKYNEEKIKWLEQQ